MKPLRSKHLMAVLGIFVAVTISGCSLFGSSESSRESFVATDTLTATLVTLRDVASPWAAAGREDITDPTIVALYDELGSCLGDHRVELFRLDATNRVLGDNLAFVGETANSFISSSSAESARGDGAADVAGLAQRSQCLEAFVTGRLIGDTTLSVDDLTSTVIDQSALAHGVLGVRVEGTVSDGSASIPFAHVFLVAGDGRVSTLYQLSTLNGVPGAEGESVTGEATVAQYAQLLSERVSSAGRQQTAPVNSQS